jgi:hypothetical protein
VNFIHLRRAFIRKTHLSGKMINRLDIFVAAPTSSLLVTEPANASTPASVIQPERSMPSRANSSVRIKKLPNQMRA